MSRVLRVAIVFTLIAAIVAGGLLSAGCGGSKKAALVAPTVELFQYSRGATVDFDEATINSAASAEANVKYGTAKAIYHSVWAANQETVANQMFPAPYWKGDGVTTQYVMLSSGDQTTVDATIFATKLTQAEQDIVTNAVSGLFSLYDEELAAAKTISQNTAYMILYGTVSASAASAWQTDATAWMAALNAKAAADYSGKTFAQLTYAQRQTVMGAVFNKGAGAINPEYAFWRAMVETSFRNGNASARWPDLRDTKVAELYSGSTYAGLDCTQKPVVDAAVWASCNQTAVEDQITGMFNLAEEQVDGVMSDNQNVYYTTLLGLGMYAPYLVTDNSSPTAAADNWLADVTGKAHDYDSSADFYAELKYGQPQWKGTLTQQYFGTDNYDALSTDAKALIDQADTGMRDLSIAQRSDVLGSDNEIPLTSNVVYQTLKYRVGSTPAADGWAAEVGAGMDRELALYKWMAYESFRNGTVATFYPTQVAAKMTALFPGRTSASLTACEKITLNNAVWAALDVYEQGFGGSVVSGLWGKVQAEMTDAIAMDQTTLVRGPTGLQAASKSATIPQGDETIVINWKKDIETGGLSVSASYYRWLAKEALIALKGLGTLIRLSEAEFLFKVTNSNKYPIILNEVGYYFYINSTALSTEAVKVDTAKTVAADDVWVPAESEVLLKVVAPVKQMGIITWLVMGGQPTAAAQKLAADVWSQYKDGTPTWIIDIQMKVTNDEGEDMQVKTYTLEGTGVA